jgi:2-polyprenyl-3-methyl-5-hydroxy-6-metoxy-1,4-benzoquinol methylase
MPGPDIKELERQALLFEDRVNQTKASLAPENIVWYPYRTLAVFPVLRNLLTGPRRSLLDLAAGDPILDLGCGDGALSFFFESLGCEVWAADNPHVNHNGMLGFNKLRAALNSPVKFHSVDLDSQFKLPNEIFGLTLLLGVFYHLKNPYYVMESLAWHTRYCLFSTRIAQRTPKGVDMKKESLAYFLAPGETNNDATNYWIFSETALRRLLDRTGWAICDFQTVGVTRGSEPARLDRDERAFCLLESRHCPRYSLQFLEGWHALERGSFRWTERRFSILLKRPPLLEWSTFRFDFRLSNSGPVTLSASVNGISVPPATFTTEGEQSYTFNLPRETLKASPIRIDFEADKCLPAGTVDERELALLVSFWKPGLDHDESLLPFHLS